MTEKTQASVMPNIETWDMETINLNLALCASACGDMDMVEKLLDAGGNPNFLSTGMKFRRGLTIQK